MRWIRTSIGTLAVLAALGGCSSPQEDKPVVAKPHPVTVTVVESRNLPVVVSAVGRLVPNREVVLSSQVSGIVRAYSVDMGDPAVAGQTLVELDASDYELALLEARANLLSARARFAAAENAFQRARALLPDKVITQELYEKVEAESIADGRRFPRPRPWSIFIVAISKKPPSRRRLAAS